jgi:hypothetical protein
LRETFRQKASRMEHLLLFAFVSIFFQAIVSLEMDFFTSIVIPAQKTIAVDESIFIKMKNPVEGQKSCLYQAPGKKDFYTPDPFVTKFDDVCGIRISKVQKNHEGIWKLISSNDRTSVKGTAIIHVKDRVVIETKQNNLVYASNENFAPSGLDLSYCYVSKNAGFEIQSEMSEIDANKCMIPKNLEKDFTDGDWTVRLGIKGESKEISFAINIQSKGEFIEVLLKCN